MSTEEIILEISADGETATVEAFGFVGPACELATAPLEQALGIEGGEREYKPEHLQGVAEQVHVRGSR